MPVLPSTGMRSLLGGRGDVTRHPLADAMTLVTQPAASCRASSSRWAWNAVLSIARSVAAYL